MGINVRAVKLKTFAISSFVVSAVGAAYAFYIGSATDETFSLQFVLGYFAMVIIGGLGSTTGAALGAIVWTLSPQVLQTLSSQVSAGTPVVGKVLTTYQSQTASLLLGVLVIVILRFRPDGLNGFWDDARKAVAAWPYKD